MLEFLTMMSVIAMIFCAATAFVAFISGVLLKVARKIGEIIKT